MPVVTGTPTLIRINDDEPIPGELKIETEVIRIQSDVATRPDPAWTFTDAAGHWHAYGKGEELPTLEGRVQHVPCNGVHSGPTMDNPCEGYETTLWHCRICGEQVRPGHVPDRDREIPGRKSWWVEVVTRGERPGGFGEGPATVRVTTGDLTLFGVAAPRIERVDSDHMGMRVVTRFHGIGPLGERRG